MIPRFAIDVRAAVTLAAPARAAEMQMATAIGGARYGLGFRDGTSIRRSATNDTPESTPNFTNLDAIVDPLVAAGALSLVLIGTSVPTWTAYKNYTGGTWGPEPNRPPVEAWPYWVADVQLCVDYIRRKYELAGLDPNVNCWFQIANEVNAGGSGGPWTSSDPWVFTPPYDNLDPGEFDGPNAGLNGWDAGYARNVGDQLQYLVENVDFRGSPVVGVAHETQTGTDFENEKASLSQLAGHFPALTHLAMNDYHTLPLVASLSKKQFAKAWTVKNKAERASLIAAYVAAGMTDAETKPWVLSEVGLNMNQCNFGTAPFGSFGHFARGQYLRSILREMFKDGRYELISIYVSHARSASEDPKESYAFANFGAAYYGAWKEIGRMHGAPSTSPPSMSTSQEYLKESGETFGDPDVS